MIKLMKEFFFPVDSAMIYYYLFKEKKSKYYNEKNLNIYDDYRKFQKKYEK